MRLGIRGSFLGCVAFMAGTRAGLAQEGLTWQEVKTLFLAKNPTLEAQTLSVDESRAQEATAHLRPNPQLSLVADQIDPFSGGAPHTTFGTLLSVGTVSYLYEREHKRDLRFESAQQATRVALLSRSDLERTLLFNLRLAFVQALEQKAVVRLAQENLEYYDRVLDVNRERYKAGGIARVDLDRLELQRVQYDSDLQTAQVSLRTAKILLLALMDDKRPLEQFDVSGPFDSSQDLLPLEQARQAALESRPDLGAATLSVDKARTDHRLAAANGSTDPTFGVDVGRNPPIDQYVGFSLSFPLRLFDRNQGEKRRTEIDIRRSESLAEAARVQVLSDVDSAHAALQSTARLLEPYKARYLEQARSVRDTIAFSYQHGAASLLDFMSAQADYRTVEVSYLSLVASYLNAAAQLNLAVGREVIP